jgi:acetyl esterase/lipase
MAPDRAIVKYFLLLLTAALLARADDVPAVAPLWSHGAPGSQARRAEPEIAHDYWVRNIHNPSLTIYLPSPEKANGGAVVIAPGGGHRVLVWDAEGLQAGQFFRSLGLTAFVLKYRLAREPGSPYTIDRDVRADGLRAVRWVRSHAEQYRLDIHRVGIVSFSAGGELAAMVCYGPNAPQPDAADPIDRPSARPDYSIFIYPGPLGFPTVIPPGAPPACFIVSNNDGQAAHVLQTVLAYRTAHVPVELHLYSHAAHAFNMGYRSVFQSIRGWPDRAADWLADSGYLTPGVVPNAGSRDH